METTSDLKNDLRTKILELTSEFAQVTLKRPEFIPGKTYIPVTTKTLAPEDFQALVSASLDGWLTTGHFADDFEKKLQALFCRSGNALFVNSGSSANLLAVTSLGSPLLKNYDRKPLEPGDEIITVAAAFPTTVNPIFQNGWVPVFIDVDPKTLNAEFDAICAARSPRTRAVVLAHTLGNPFRSDLVAEWCKNEGIYLIEDCCDALGATVGSDHAPAGSFGDFATLSFYPAHHITTGEGGAVSPKDSGWKRVAESLRDWGRDCWCPPGVDNTCKKRFGWKWESLPDGYDHKYVYSSIGYNLKATDMQAAIGLTQLDKLPDFIAKRRDNWKALHTGITSSPVLRDRFIPVEPTPMTEPSWFGFAIHCAPGVMRSKVVSFLEENRIGTRPLFGGNLTQQPAYQGREFRIVGDLEQTKNILHDLFWIGVHPQIGSAETTYILETLEKTAKSL